MKSISFVVPVYNEEKTLEKIIKKIENLELGLKKEIILVNDKSTDSTPKILNKPKFQNKKIFKVFHNKKNLGKSQTVKKGLMRSSGDLVVIQDADLEYEPKELKAFVKQFKKGDVDVIYGNRFGINNKIIYLQNWIGNRALSAFSGIITGMRSGMWTSDMETCYKMAKGKIFRNIAKTIESTSTFGLEPELTAKFSKYKIKGKNLRFKQIPISYHARTIEEGKHMSAFKDGIKAFWEIIKFNFFR